MGLRLPLCRPTVGVDNPPEGGTSNVIIMLIRVNRRPVVITIVMQCNENEQAVLPLVNMKMRVYSANSNLLR